MNKVMNKLGLGCFAVASFALIVSPAASAENQYNVCRGSLCDNESSVNGVMSGSAAEIRGEDVGITLGTGGSGGETRSSDSGEALGTGGSGGETRPSRKAGSTVCAPTAWVAVDHDGNTDAGELTLATSSACEE